MNAATGDSIRPVRNWQRPFVAVVVVVIVAITLSFRDSFSLQSLVYQQDAVRKAAAIHPGIVYGSAFLLYALVTGLSIPGAGIMSIAYGSLFGLLPALAIVSFASTAGATMAFVLSRFLFRDLIQARFGRQLVRFNEALAREGAMYLFTLRLIPQAPFFLVNLLMGLTPIRTTTFWWVSQVGMLPGTCVYVYAGASIGDLQAVQERGVSGILTWQLGLAFALLGLFPLIARRIVRLFTHRSITAVSEK